VADEVAMSQVFAVPACTEIWVSVRHSSTSALVRRLAKKRLFGEVAGSRVCAYSSCITPMCDLKESGVWCLLSSV